MNLKSLTKFCWMTNKNKYPGCSGEYINKHKNNLVKSWDSCDIPEYLFDFMHIAKINNEKQLAKYINWCIYVHQLPNKKTMLEVSEQMPAASLALRQAELDNISFAAQAISKQMNRATKLIVEDKFKPDDHIKKWKASAKAEASLEVEQAKQLKKLISNPFNKKKFTKNEPAPDNPGNS